METIGVNTPFFSIIVPLYNKEHTVKRCVESVLAQTCEDWELLVINDGSKDGGASVMSQYTDRRIRYLEHPNHGVSYTRNRGLDEARGVYIHFLDADDYLEPDRLEILRKDIERRPADIYFTGVTICHTDGQMEARRFPYEGTVQIQTVRRDFYRIEHDTSLYGYVPMKIMRRSFYEKHQLRFDESLRLSEDLDLFVRCYQKAQSFYYISDCGYVYMLYDGGTSMYSDNVDYFSLIGVQRRMVDWLGNDMLPADKEKHARKLVNFASCALCCITPSRVGRIPQIARKLQSDEELMAYISQYGKGDKILQMFMDGHIRQLQIYVWIKQMYIKLYQWLHQK